jgi:A/G-specific adenine glycosylase
MKTTRFPSGKKRAAAHAALLRWYRAHGRKDLPWRHTDDPYAIYISEVMLQQTQVKTVLERFYGPFLESFPTLRHLAAAPREKVMKAWQGLGYYRRAAFLHEAAKACGGKLPETLEGLIALPGIGRNTAHAILAFAHHRPLPVMEANVKRILARLFALEAPSEKELWEKAEWLLDTKNPFDFNQAMMDIGALVCLPRNPACGNCPLATVCAGRKTPQRYPASKAKKTIPVRKRVLVIWQDEKGRIYLSRRDGPFLTGLYGFPEFAEGEPAMLENRRMNVPLEPLGQVRHTYSHFKLEGRVVRGRVENLGSQGRTLQAARKLPLSKVDQLALALL